jgi:hypothetical protein
VERKEVNAQLKAQLAEVLSLRACFTTAFFSFLGAQGAQRAAQGTACRGPQSACLLYYCFTSTNVPILTPRARRDSLRPCLLSARETLPSESVRPPRSYRSLRHHLLKASYSAGASCEPGRAAHGRYLRPHIDA